MLDTIKKYFKAFFLKTYSKPFVILSIVVIALGAISALYIASTSKQGVDVKIAQKEEELSIIFDAQNKKKSAEYQEQYDNYKKCILKNKGYSDKEVAELYSNYKLTTEDKRLYGLSGWRNGCREPLYRRSVGDTYVSDSGLLAYHGFESDPEYDELSRIKEISTVRLAAEKFGFGWWGVIGLATVFLINILIVFYKLIKVYIPIAFRYGNRQVKSIKTNMQDMAPFQRYSLTLFGITVLGLLIIAAVLIF